MSKNKIEKIVASYVSKKRSYFATKVLIGIAVAAICAFSAIILLDSQIYLPSGVRMSVSVLAALAGVGALIWAVILPCVAFRQKQAVQEIEAHSENNLGQMLRTSIEASQREHESPITAAMSEMLIEQTAEKMKDVDTSKYIPWKIVAKRVAILLVICAAVFGIDQVWGGFSTGVQRFTAPTKDITYTTVTATASTTVFREESILKKIKNAAAKKGQANKVEAKAPVVAKPVTANLPKSKVPTTVKISAKVSGLNPGSATVYVRDVAEENWEHYDMNSDGDNKYSIDLGSDKILNTFDYYVKSGDGISKTYRVRKQENPKIIRVKTVLDFPEYTLRKREIKDTADIDALEGTKVKVNFVLNHKLTNLKLCKYTPAGKDVYKETFIPVKQVENPKDNTVTITAEFPMEVGRCKYRLIGSDQDGLHLPERNFILLGRKDHKPNIELLAPKKEITISRLGEINFKMFVDDDVRISEVGVMMILGEDEERVVHKIKFNKIVREKTVKFAMLLEDLDLDINSSVILHGYVKDGKNRKITVCTDPIFLNIRPFKVYKRKKKAKKGQPKKKKQKKQLIKLEKAIKGQRKVITETFKFLKNQVIDDVRFEKLVKEQTKLTKDVKELSDAMQKSDKVEPFVKEAVLKASNQMFKVDGHLGVSQGDLKIASTNRAAEYPTKNLSKAFRSETLALAALINARQNLLKVMKEQQKKKNKKKNQKKKSKSKNKKQQQSPAAKFAATLEQIAKKESEAQESLKNRDMMLEHDAVAGAYDQHDSAIDMTSDVIMKMEEMAKPEFEPVVEQLQTLYDGDMAKAYDILKVSKPDCKKAEMHLRLSETEIRDIIVYLKGLDPAQLPNTMKKIRDDLNEAARLLEEAKKETTPDSDGKLSKFQREKANRLTQSAKDLTSRVNKWVGNLKNANLNGLEGLKERLDRTQKSGLDLLPGKIDSINRRRRFNEFKESNKKAGDIANELRKYAGKFDKEFNDLNRSLLKKLANAKATAKAAKGKGKKSSKPGGKQPGGKQPGGKPKPNAESKLNAKIEKAKALLSQLKDLKGKQFQKLAKQLEEALKTPGKEIPKELLDKIIAALDKEMEMIETTSLLGDEPAVVPDSYKSTVSQYKVDLSKDLVTEEDENGARRSSRR